MLNTEQSRAGALACLNAMRIIERISRGNGPELSNEDWWINKEVEVSAMLQAAGVSDGFMAGFVAACAEYVSDVESAGTPNLYRWKPIASMTEEEISSYKLSLETD